MENKSYVISQDEEGKFERVWVEQKVKNPASLIALQQGIAAVNPDFKPTSIDTLHMTIAHFGIPEELYTDAKKFNPALPFDQLMAEFYKLLQKIDKAIKSEVQVQAEKLDIFGQTPYHVAVIKIVNTPELVQQRQVVSQSLQQFVKNLGILDVHQFMLNSQFQFEPDEIYKPHVTLGFAGENTTLPKLDISSLQMVLNPSNICNVNPI